MGQIRRMGRGRMIRRMSGNRWRPIWNGPTTVVVLPVIAAVFGRFQVATCWTIAHARRHRQQVRATHPEGRFTVHAVMAGVIVAQHPRLPQAQIGNLEVRIALLE